LKQKATTDTEKQTTASDQPESKIKNLTPVRTQREFQRRCCLSSRTAHIPAQDLRRARPTP